MPKLKQKINIVFTGGHAATTALATIQELQSRREVQANIFWIGSARAIESQKIAGIESQVFPQIGVSTHYIQAGRIQRRFTRHTIPSLFRIPIGIVQAFILLLKIKPKVVISFGGYAGFPCVLSAWILRIPVILHEQTIATGLANKASSFFADKIAISHQESSQFFPNQKIVLTGNPVLGQIRNVKSAKARQKPSTIFITGGSRGSQIINNTVDKILPQLLQNYNVVHQVGVLDYSHFKKRQQELRNSKRHYEVFEIINPLEIANFYEKADLYIGRSGANTVSEIILTQKHAILIPIPWTRFDEQNKNASKARELGLAQVIAQDDLDEKSLLDAIEYQMHNWNKIHQNINITTSSDINGAKNLVDLVLNYV